MSKINANNPDYSRNREFTVILEDLQSQFQVFGEGQEMLTQKVDKLSDRIDRLDHRLGKVEIVVNHLNHRMEKVENNFDRFFGVLNDHEKRITTLEPTTGLR